MSEELSTSEPSVISEEEASVEPEKVTKKVSKSASASKKKKKPKKKRSNVADNAVAGDDKEESSVDVAVPTPAPGDVTAPDDIVGALADAVVADASDDKNNNANKSELKKKGSKGSKKAKKVEDLDDDEDSEKDPDADLPPVGLGALFRFSTGFERFLLAIGFLCASGMGAVQPIFMILFGDSIDSLSAAGAGGFDDLLIYFLYLGAGGGVAGFISSYFCNYVNSRIADRIREQYVSALLRQEMAYYDQRSTGKLVARVSGDVDQIQDGIAKIPMALQTVTVFIGGFIVGFIYSWRMGVVIIACTPLMCCIGVFFSKLIATMSRDGQGSYGRSIAVATETLSAVRVVFAFGTQESERQRYNKAVDEGVAKTARGTKIAGIGIGISICLIYLIQSLALWYGSTLIIDGEGSPGNILTAYFAIFMGAMSLGQIAEPLTAVATARGVAAAVYDVIFRDSEIDATINDGTNDFMKGKPSAAASPLDLQGFVEFKDVKFAYPTRPDVPVLKGVSFSVKPGKTLALIGQSGCGKSTCIGLIERFYNHLSGDILIDGKPIADYDVKQLRNRIALVSQEPILFARTIKENILLGAVDGQNPTDEDVISAAKRANAHGFISKLPDGYDTLVGERGNAQMSGGQKQRICIARALIRNPAILLLDEATSALDSASEMVVQSALDEISSELTTIVIAHRLSTIKDADEILVFDKGVIAERGNHSKLLKKKNGVYAEQYRLQQKAENRASDKKTSKSRKKALKEADEVVQFDDKRRMSNASVSGLESAKELDSVGFLKACRIIYSWIAVDKVQLFFATLFAALDGASAPAATLFLVEIIFSMLMLIPGTPLYNLEEGEKGIRTWVLVFVGVAVWRGSLLAGRVMLLGKVTNKMIGNIRKQLYSKMLSQEVGWFDDVEHRPGVLTTKMSTDADNISRNLSQAFPGAVVAFCTVVTALTIGYVYCPMLALVLTFTFPLVALGGVMHMRAMVGDSKATRRAYESGGMRASEAVANVRTVASLGREKTFSGEYCTELVAAGKLVRRRALYAALSSAVTQFIQFGTWALAFWYGGILVADGDCNTQDMFTTVIAIIFSSQQVGSSLSLITNVDAAVDAVDSILSVLNRVSLLDAEAPTANAIKDVAITGKSKFQDVQFAYPSRPNQAVLRKLNLAVRAKKTLALVGASGSGKSTIIQLLLRYYDVDGGEVVMDGNDMREYDLQFLRSNMAIVPQEPTLFDRTIEENIRYGCPDATSEDVVKAAKLANAHRFIESFPDKYKTVVGETGSQLSGGQKQRIAIARAIIRKPKLLLLDEATSALDNESQLLVQEALERASKKTTTVVIAHRLSTIQNCDEICVVDRGVIVEQGTHSELIEAKGAYFSLVQHQLLVQGDQ